MLYKSEIDFSALTAASAHYVSFPVEKITCLFGALVHFWAETKLDSKRLIELVSSPVAAVLATLFVHSYSHRLPLALTIQVLLLYMLFESNQQGSSSFMEASGL